jgi:hypothetical protein
MPVNTNDLRDMASEFRGTTFTEMVIEAANQLDSTRTERNILRAELTAAREELRDGGWCYDMEKAPKDGSYILAIVRQTDDRHMGRQAGRVFCIRYENFGDKYGGWAVYPGYGGAPDSFFTAWRRIDVPPTRAQGESS